jgi:hypothetical protein
MVILPIPKTCQLVTPRRDICPTGENQILERLYAHGAGARVYQENMRIFQCLLTRGCPQTKLPVVLLLLVRGAMEEDWRRRIGNDFGHFKDVL